MRVNGYQFDIITRMKKKLIFGVELKILILTKE